MSLVHGSEELLVGATPCFLDGRNLFTEQRPVFGFQGNLSTSGTEQKFADRIFSVPQLFIKVKESFGN